MLVAAGKPKMQAIGARMRKQVMLGYLCGARWPPCDHTLLMSHVAEVLRSAAMITSNLTKNSLTPSTSLNADSSAFGTGT